MLFAVGADGYRLGDMLTSRFFRNTAGGKAYHVKKFPRSLATRYLVMYRIGTPTYDAFFNGSCAHYNHRTCVMPPGKCQCYVPHKAALAHMLAEDTQYPCRETAALHLRVGDVLDLSPFRVDEILANETAYSTRCWGASSDIFAACTQSATRGANYVRPLSAYDDIRRRLLALGNISRVVIVAGSHRNLTSFQKSCSYLERIGRLFQRDFSVSFRLGSNPDDDLRLFARAAVFVPGGGGFGKMAAEAVKELGVRVLRLPPVDTNRSRTRKRGRISRAERIATGGVATRDFSGINFRQGRS